MLTTLRLWSALLFATLLAACSQPAPTAPAAPADAQGAPVKAAAVEPGLLKVMTFNIRYGTADDGEDRWEKRRGLLMDVIRADDPDVIGLQEALRFQIDEIIKAVPGYAEFGVGRDDGKEKGEYSAILYRTARVQPAGDPKNCSGTFWLSDSPDEVASKTWGNGITRICTWARLELIPEHRRFSLYNTHLDHQSDPSRRKSVELIARRIVARPQGSGPVLLTGDFNCGESSASYHFITGRAGNASGGLGVSGWSGLTDTFRAVHPGEANVRTFHAFKGVDDTTGKGGPAGALTEKIDFIFVDKAWTVLDAAINRTSRDGRYPSDHYPVTARVVLGAEPRR